MGDELDIDILSEAYVYNVGRFPRLGRERMSKITLRASYTLMSHVCSLDSAPWRTVETHREGVGLSIKDELRKISARWLSRGEAGKLE